MAGTSPAMTENNRVSCREDGIMDIKVRSNGALLAEGFGVTLTGSEAEGSSTVLKRGTVIRAFTSPTTPTRSRPYRQGQRRAAHGVLEEA